jgi:hypothetical protein
MAVVSNLVVATALGTATDLDQLTSLPVSADAKINCFRGKKNPKGQGKSHLDASFLRPLL